MSVYLYEESLVNAFRELTGDDRIHIIAPENAISFFAQFDKDKVKFPAIVISRNSVSLVTDTRNQVAMLKGATARLKEEDSTVVKALSLPIKIDWSIDVYAVDRFSCDEIIRELVFYLTTHPRFFVKIPYDLNIEQNFNVFLNQEIADNSDLVAFPNTGEIFRETLSIYTDNARFFSTKSQYPTSIDVHTEVVNKSKEV